MWCRYTGRSLRVHHPDDPKRQLTTHPVIATGDGLGGDIQYLGDPAERHPAVYPEGMNNAMV
jgi:hypothetical protein